MNFITKAVSSNTRFLGLRSFTTVVSWSDMTKSKHDFVHFVKTSVDNKASPEAAEMYQYLMKCFVDNDSDYDGYVSFKGFNNMIHEAALAPRRFGFAPHTRELYDSKESFDAARTQLFETLAQGNDRITLDAWVSWGMAHIAEKAVGLEEHSDARWERSSADFTAFVKGVTAASSHNCKRSSSSTQYKEFYMLSLDLFAEADTNCDGSVDEAGFAGLVEATAAIPARFGHSWYAGANFSDLAVDGKLTWTAWFKYTLGVTSAGAASL